ncbi:hypothetical protein, partial [Nonomuraea sp. NPDC050691]|uniref:hypothetical protein n=1 Tax=Nonomuraea sp. NPDC050691 TaxID=3155661 RepID=UPI00340D8627
MTTDERRLRWRHLLDLLRPRARTARPSRAALVADVLLAAVLTVAALLAATGSDGGGGQAGEGPRPVSELLR